MIAAILLAAGNARRFDGSQKLVAAVPYNGDPIPLVRLTTLGILAAGLQRIVAVTGRDAALVRGALAGLTVALTENSEYAAGMSGSLRIGVAEALRLWPGVDGLLI